MATTKPPAAPAGCVLAFDFGTRRIGVAVGDTSVALAHPLATIAAEKNDQRFAAIRGLINEWKPALLIVGLPVHADGTEHDMTSRARRFARQLEGRFGLPVVLVDERFTTHTASTALAEARLRKHEHKAVRDQIAAHLTLQAYLDQRAAATRAT